MAKFLGVAALLAVVSVLVAAPFAYLLSRVAAYSPEEVREIVRRWCGLSQLSFVTGLSPNNLPSANAVHTSPVVSMGAPIVVVFNVDRSTTLAAAQARVVQSEQSIAA